MKKKAVLAVVVFIFALLGVGCNPQPNQEEKVYTVLDRAKELSEYYDSVPGSYDELLSANNVAEEKQESAKQCTIDVFNMATEIEHVPNVITPEYRPHPLTQGVVSEEEYYGNNAVEVMLATAKEFAEQARYKFRNCTSGKLNKWVGHLEPTEYINEVRAERLQYVKQLDTISEEVFYKNGTEINYYKSKLFLSKNHKINFSFVGLGGNAETKNVTNGHYYEYVEDEYYYYIFNSFSENAMNYVIYVDLTTKPFRIFNASGADYGGGGMFDKSISLELEDGKKITYGFNRQAMYLYNNDGDIMLCKYNEIYGNGNVITTKEKLSIDLWQTIGWSRLETTSDIWEQSILYTKAGDFDISGIGDEIGCYSSGLLYEDESGDVNISTYFRREDFGSEALNVKLRVFNNNEPDILAKSAYMLEKIGLAYKEDLSDIYAEYFAKSFSDTVAPYSFNRLDFATMDRYQFKKVLASQHFDTLLSDLLDEIADAEVYADYEINNSEQVNEPYEMLDSLVNGTVAIELNEGMADFADLKIIVPDSVLHIEGDVYYAEIGLSNGKNFLKLAGGEAIYNNDSMEIAFTGTASLCVEMDYDTNYTLTAYVSNNLGIRCSELFYPNIGTPDGEIMISENDGKVKYWLSVKDGTVNIRCTNI